MDTRKKEEIKEGREKQGYVPLHLLRQSSTSTRVFLIEYELSAAAQKAIELHDYMSGEIVNKRAVFIVGSHY